MEKKKTRYKSQPCVVRGHDSSSEGTWIAEPLLRLINLYTSRRQKAVPNEQTILKQRWYRHKLRSSVHSEADAINEKVTKERGSHT